MISLYLFNPLGKITEIGDFVTACANRAEYEAWLWGDHMLIHINALRAIRLSSFFHATNLRSAGASWPQRLM